MPCVQTCTATLIFVKMAQFFSSVASHMMYVHGTLLQATLPGQEVLPEGLPVW